MNKCLRVNIQRKKIWILILGCPIEDVIKNRSLVYEILKTIGSQMGIDYLKQIDDFGELQEDTENPDFVVKLCNGKIDIVDFI